MSASGTLSMPVQPPLAPAGTGAVLYVHPSGKERAALRDRLACLGGQVTIAGDVADAARLLDERRFGLVIVDLADGRASLSVVRVLRATQPALPLVGIVDPASPATAAEAIRSGLTDLLPWPFEDADVMSAVVNARDRAALNGRGAAAPAAGGLFAQSAAMRQVLEDVRASASSRRGLIVAGEPGTGREFVARAVHALEARSGSAFVRVDCSASPGELEHTLFGTPAARTEDARAAGERLSAESAIARADGGTLFLAHLTDAPARIQMRLARLLRDAEAIVGDAHPVVELDVRVIAAIEPDVDAAIADGRLRRDLVDRLSLSRIDVPPLSRRREDIPLLALQFLQEGARGQTNAPKTFSRAAMAVLAALPWHGNARELRALVESLSRSVPRPVIQVDDVLEHARLDGSSRIDHGVTLRDAKVRFERECISAVLIRHHGRVGEAAKALGIQRTNLYRKVRQLNVARSLLSSRR